MGGRGRRSARGTFDDADVAGAAALIVESGDRDVVGDAIGRGHLVALPAVLALIRTT